MEKMATFFVSELYYFSKSFWAKKLSIFVVFNAMTLIHFSEVPYVYCSNRSFLGNFLTDKIRFFYLN